MGENLRCARVVRGLSQTDLGALAGVTFQQIQKYEKGVNRISISRLYVLCGALGCRPAEILPEFDQPAQQHVGGVTLSTDALRLAADYDRIKDQAVRDAYRNFCRAMNEN